MKKIVILFFLFCVNTVFAQTYSYKHLYSIDRDGVKNRGTGRIIHYTFSDNMRNVYSSDKNGYKYEGESYLGSTFKYIFTGTKNSIHVYENEWIVYPPSKRVKVPVQNGNSYADILARGQYQLNMNAANTEYQFAQRTGAVIRFSSDFRKINIYPIKWGNEGGNYDLIDVYELYDESSSDNFVPFYE